MEEKKNEKKFVGGFLLCLLFHNISKICGDKVFELKAMTSWSWLVGEALLFMLVIKTQKCILKPSGLLMSSLYHGHVVHLNVVKN